MQRTRLLFGVAAVLAGIATLQFVLGFVYSPVLFGVAVPFAAAAYLLWYHASGRLRERVESGRAGTYRRVDAERGGFGAGPRDTGTGRSRFGGPESGGFAGARGGQRTRGGQRARATGQPSGPSTAEAYRRLGLDPGADDAAVRRAYREKVKAVHPDRETGDEEQFKRVKEAYEKLQERR